MNKVLNDPNNKYYKKALKVEIELGKSGLTAPETYPQTLDLHPDIIEYRNSLISGKKDQELFAWIDAVMKDIPTCKLGLTLGSGTGKEALYLQNKGYVNEWHSIDIVEPKKNKLTVNNTNKYIYGDLNFIELPKNTYDIVICFGVLHHLVNLEHILFQINQTLTEDGVFLVFEYVGESKWNFGDSKKEFIQENLNKAFGKVLNFKKRDMSIRPLESIRSRDIPDLIDYYWKSHKLYEKVWNSIVYPGINMAVMCQNINKDLSYYDKVVNVLIELNKEFDDNYIPTELIGLYRKHQNVQEKVVTQLWDKEQMKKQFDDSAYLKTKIKRKVKRLIPKFFFEIYLFLRRKIKY